MDGGKGGWRDGWMDEEMTDDDPLRAAAVVAGTHREGRSFLQLLVAAGVRHPMRGLLPSMLGPAVPHESRARIGCLRVVVELDLFLWRFLEELGFC